MKNNLAIIGSRNFNNYSYAKKHILNIIQKNNISINKIISGGASGADKIAETFASKFNIPIEIIKADWSKGKAAGVMRNTDIIKKSEYVIAFWDKKSKGTLDSINKAKRLGRKLFVVDISPNAINEGARIDSDGEYVFDFKNDEKDDILYLKYNKDYIVTKKTRGVISYYSYKINKNVDKNTRKDFLLYVKSKLKSPSDYDPFLNKAVIGLFNNPKIEVADADLILIPQSSSTVNLDLANKIKNKIPNALFLKDGILKNEPENAQFDHDTLREKGATPKTIQSIEHTTQSATVGGVFKIKKIPPKFRRYILNFLKLDNTNRRLLNKIVDGKVVVVDDFITEGTTFREINRLIENYSPKEIILFSLIG